MAKVTRTINPLHFEDLEPHKFEDVVRGLLYDFRDWQSLEPTGKKGSDDGFDIRAWEKVKVVENESDEKENQEELNGEHIMEGNLWMIQCKREKIVTPKKIEKILEDVDNKNPPYGYILAAATDFSKKAQDTFRDILLKKGVTEFYLWGKSHLEDMLYLPKNDYILFTTFGISLNTRRKSRKVELKFVINNKNKAFRIWGGPDSTPDYKPALIRNFNDENYPHEDEYPDFNKNPRWFESRPTHHNALGLWFRCRERFAYFDWEKKEYDVFTGVDLFNRQSDHRLGKDFQKQRQLEQEARDFWEHLPIKNQARLSIDGLIEYKDMLVIDDKGDHSYNFPHIFTEFGKYGENSPFSRSIYAFETNQKEMFINDEFKRVNIFPKKLPKQKLGKVHKVKLDIPYEAIGLYEGKVTHNGNVFCLNGKYTYKVGEVIIVEDNTKTGAALGDRHLEITHVYQTTVKQFLAENTENPYKYRDFISQQIGKEAEDSDEITVFEVRSVRL